MHRQRRPALLVILVVLSLSIGIMNHSLQARHGDAQGSSTRQASELPSLPQGVTSFGAAVIDGHVYLYGGNNGEAHEYSRLGQSNQLLRVNARSPEEWVELAEGPRMQGLAMVAYNGALYRVGGFSARNEAGQPQDLWSSNSFARYNVDQNAWEELPPLPEPRSSHDAALLDGTLYVVGGWSMQGDTETVWHDTAYACDLSAEELEWRQLPNPPFQRRAISMSAADGKMYVIGGMAPDGPTVAVAAYDPQTNTWSVGPNLPGEGMEGFGSAACSVDGRLFVSTYGGNVYRLGESGSEWEKLAQLTPGRFFHQMVEVDGSLVLVGGANMESGRLRESDVVPIKNE